MARAPRLLVALLLACGVSLAPVLGLTPTAAAATGQLGTPQVTLNPGGGSRPDGTDGLRFTVNSNGNGESHANIPGQDSLFYRDTQQYCCTAGGPMLNVGGTLFGQAGPAYYESSEWFAGSADWSSLTVVSTSGSAVEGDLTDRTGNGRVKLRYQAVKEGLTYTVDRTISYIYPNDFVTDSYDFTIPTGNTQTVKFYLGGDTAPGDSDSGYGVMLTSPVRSVISLNPYSQIQFGIRETPGSKTFDGATSQFYYAPYDTVAQGGDIGFVATTQIHDAGLMVQWNLGSTPGTQSGTVQQFVNKQGTNLTAGFDRTNTPPGVPVTLDMSLANTVLTQVNDVGFTISLPAGTTVAAGATSNTCGGTLTTTPGSTQVSLAGGSVGAATNCVAAVPVVATDYGTYTLTADSVTAVSAGVSNNVGTSSFFVPQAPGYAPDAAFGDLTVGTSTTQSVATSQGAPPPTYAVTAGALPAGLVLDEDAGTVTGTPTAAGPYSFTVTATNSGGTATHTFTGAVAKGTPALSGSASPAAPSYGQEVTLTLADLPPSATGTATFRSGDQTLCTVTLPDTSCVVTDDLDPGTYPVEVAYSGDANWADRTVALAGLTVSTVATTLGGSLADDTIRYGSTTTVKTSLTPSGATGTITVTAGSLDVCTITLPATSCTTPDDLPAGTHTLALSYGGDARHDPSSAVVGPLTVERATAGTDPDSDVFGTYGEKTTVRLRGLPAQATGTVTVRVDGKEVCSYDLGDDPASCDVPGDLAAGEHDLVYAYSGDDNFEPSETTATLQIDPASTAVTAPATASGTFGSPTTIRVDGLPEGATGTVTVAAGGQSCTFTVPDEDSCDLPGTLAAGDYTALVSYSGDDDHLGSNTTVDLTVEPQQTDVAADDPQTVPFGTPATVSVSGLPSTATGVVTVTGVDDEGTSVGTVCTIDLDEGQDSCATTVPLAAGTYTLTVRYPGDPNHAASEKTVTLTVAKQTTTLSTPAELEDATFGTPVLVSAGSLPQGATGRVVVREGDKELCSYEVPAESSCALPADLGAGEHDLVVAYSGDDDFAASSATTTLTVAKQAAQVSASVSASNVYGSSGSVQIAGLPTSATGTVTVTVKGTDRKVCTIDLGAAADADRCASDPDLPAGSYTLVVSYPGDDDHEPSTVEVPFVVGKATVQVDPAPESAGTVGKPVGLEFPNSKGLTGLVVVTYTGPDGQTGELCRFTLPDETTCEGPTDLAAGTYALRWAYAGDANHAPSETTTSLVVAKAATQITTEDEFSTDEGTPATITVGGLPDDATGEVVVSAVSDDEARLAVGRSLARATAALCTIDVAQSLSCDTPSDLAAGKYDLEVTYGGDASYEGSTARTVLTVEASDTSGDGGDSDDGGDSATGSSSSGGGTTLASTGGPSLAVLVLGALLTVGGGALTVSRRRRSARSPRP